MTPRPKDSTPAKTEKSRQRILESAEAAFAAKGFDGANMREIASSAGVNKYMLYYHFDDKKTLFEHILNAILTPVFRKLTAAIEPAADLEEAIANVYQIYADLFAARGGHLRAFMAREIAAGAPRAKYLFRAKGPEMAALWGKKLDEYAGRPVNPEQVGLIIMSIMTGIVSTFLMSPLYEAMFDKLDLDISGHDLKAHVIKYVLGGIDMCLASGNSPPETGEGK
ncbi:MAG: TetR/AcrR family transcriptional regulator [Candidatus Marinimicrobia bacterium]|nr:TetR/AcrR family transcriptional regulator [Candidatus Neomarinimicrobiota bacterium]